MDSSYQVRVFPFHLLVSFPCPFSFLHPCSLPRSLSACMGGALYFLPSWTSRAGRQESFTWQGVSSLWHESKHLWCASMLLFRGSGNTLDLYGGGSEDWGAPVACCGWIIAHKLRTVKSLRPWCHWLIIRFGWYIKLMSETWRLHKDYSPVFGCERSEGFYNPDFICLLQRNNPGRVWNYRGFSSDSGHNSEVRLSLPFDLALQELASACAFGCWQDELILYQLIDKAADWWIREKLLM